MSTPVIVLRFSCARCHAMTCHGVVKTYSHATFFNSSVSFALMWSSSELARKPETPPARTCDIAADQHTCGDEGYRAWVR